MGSGVFAKVLFEKGLEELLRLLCIPMCAPALDSADEGMTAVFLNEASRRFVTFTDLSRKL